jgi:hypothetical protein
MGQATPMPKIRFRLSLNRKNAIQFFDADDFGEINPSFPIHCASYRNIVTADTIESGKEVEKIWGVPRRPVCGAGACRGQSGCSRVKKKQLWGSRCRLYR